MEAMLLFLLASCLVMPPRSAIWSTAPTVVNGPGSVCSDETVQRAASFWGLEVGTYPQAYSITVLGPTQRLSTDEVAATWRYTDHNPDGLAFVIKADIEAWRCDDPRILMHEIGHGLGYGHGGRGTIMAEFLEDLGYVRP